MAGIIAQVSVAWEVFKEVRSRARIALAAHVDGEASVKDLLAALTDIVALIDRAETVMRRET